MPVMAGEFLARIGAAAIVDIADGASASGALPTDATRGYRVTAVDAPMFLQLGDSAGVTVNPALPQIALANNESIEFRARVDGQTHIAGYGRGSAGKLLITELSD